mmetsp:Transcript_109953/g.190729  ORF Transcript_109953/g.190729 Transcript_109953/m.190729 type:complete len:85 (+) Transcript_109953:628-882(+)
MTLWVGRKKEIICGSYGGYVDHHFAGPPYLWRGMRSWLTHPKLFHGAQINYPMTHVTQLYGALVTSLVLWPRLYLTLGSLSCSP